MLRVIRIRVADSSQVFGQAALQVDQVLPLAGIQARHVSPFSSRTDSISCRMVIARYSMTSDSWAA